MIAENEALLYRVCFDMFKVVFSIMSIEFKYIFLNLELSLASLLKSTFIRSKQRTDFERNNCKIHKVLQSWLLQEEDKTLRAAMAGKTVKSKLRYCMDFSKKEYGGSSRRQ